MAYVRNYPTDLAALAERLPNIKTPVQIISGRSDPYVPFADAVALHEELPNAALNILECGHFAWEEAGVEYLSIVSAWLAGAFGQCR